MSKGSSTNSQKVSFSFPLDLEKNLPIGPNLPKLIFRQLTELGLLNESISLMQKCIKPKKQHEKQHVTTKHDLPPENNLKKIYFFWTKKQQTKNRILPSRFLEITATLNAGPAASSRLFLPSPPRRRIGDQHMNPERHQRWPFLWWQVVRKSWNYQRSIGKTMTMKNSWWFTSMKKVTFFTRSSNIVRKRSFFQFLLSTNKSAPFTSQNFWAPSNNSQKNGESKPQRGSQSDASRFWRGIFATFF